MIQILTGRVDRLGTEPGRYPVSAARQEKVSRCPSKEEVRRILGAELLLQAGLRDRCPSFEPPPVLETDDAGKPRLACEASVHFNLSHSGEWAACVLADMPVGIDLERIRRGKPLNAVRRFHPLERAAVEQAADPEEALIRYWVLKESYLKALGCGLRTELAGFCVRPVGRTGTAQVQMKTGTAACAQRYAVWQDGGQRPCELLLLPAPPGCRLAVCCLCGRLQELIFIEEVKLG